MAPYEPRTPSRTVLYKVIAVYLETFLALLDDDPEATGLPAYVRGFARSIPQKWASFILESP